MQILLDSAETDEIATWIGQGVCAGVTTNPVLLRRQGLADVVAFVQTVSPLLRGGPLHLQLDTRSPIQAVTDEAAAIAAVYDQVVFKVPIVRSDGTAHLNVISTLRERGYVVNATACFTSVQTTLACEAGATYASVLIGRIRDEGRSPGRVIKKAAQARPTLKIVAASLRGPADLALALHSKASVVTCPPDVLRKAIDHKYSRHTAREFEEAIDAPID